MNSGEPQHVDVTFVEGGSGGAGHWRLTLRRAAKRNALSAAVISELRERIGEVVAERGAPLLIVRAEGPSFCAGADLHALSSLDERSAAAFITSLHHALAALRDLDLVTVALIQGACVGAGLELAASCDLRIASEDAWFAMPEVAIGVPSVIEAALLPRLIGWSACADLVLTGRRMEPREALERGLLREIVPGDWDRVEERLIDEMSALDPAAVRSQKQLLRIWEERFPSAAIRAGIDAFAASYTDPGHVRRRIERVRADQDGTP